MKRLAALDPVGINGQATANLRLIGTMAHSLDLPVLEQRHDREGRAPGPLRPVDLPEWGSGYAGVLFWMAVRMRS